MGLSVLFNVSYMVNVGREATCDTSVAFVVLPPLSERSQRLIVSTIIVVLFFVVVLPSATTIVLLIAIFQIVQSHSSPILKGERYGFSPPQESPTG